MLRVLGINVEYGEQIDPGKYQGTLKTVGDVEHSEILELYRKGSSMQEIARIKDRSSATISSHVRVHNSYVDRMAYCPRCRRTGSEYATHKVGRRYFEDTVQNNVSRAQIDQIIKLVKWKSHLHS